MEKILIAGGSGFIGQRLTELLLSEPHTKVAWLSRNPNQKAPVELFGWNPSKKTIDSNALKGVTSIINLAGAGIADKRWTKSQKKLLVDSRVDSTRTLEKAILEQKPTISTYLGASAIGYYGNSGEIIVHESSPAGTGFLTESTLEWENAHHTLTKNTGVRTALLRIGIVLEKGGGALKEIERPIHFGAASYFADGKAWYSWIHRDDVCRMFIWALKNPKIEGIYNATAPQSVRNKELVNAIKKAMGKFAITVPAPAFAMRLMLGEMGDVVLNSTQVSSEKIEKAGFHFDYPLLENALQNIYN